MKRLLSLILAIAMMCCMLPFNAFNLTARAVENTEKITEYMSGCFTYTYDALKGEATIVRCDTSVSGEVTIPSTLDGCPVTEIGDRAFLDCKLITKLTIPKSISVIEECAFSSCNGLSEITYYGTRYDWSKIDIAFGNQNLNNTKINYTYGEPSEGLEIVWVDSNDYYDQYHGYFVTGIGSCTDTDIVIPEMYDGERVIGISEKAFEGNENITSVYIPSNVTYIEKRAFADCTNLISAEVHGRINDRDHSDWRGYAIFSGCSSLEFLYTYSLEFRAEYANGWPHGFPVGFLFGRSSYEGCKACTQYYWECDTATMKPVTYYFPESLKTVQLKGTYYDLTDPFYGCTTIERVILENGKIAIGDTYGYNGEFYHLVNLKTITIPDTIEKIGYSALSSTNIEEIFLPNSITEIDRYAFSGCNALKDVYYYGTEEEWNNITIASDNDSLTNANIYYMICSCGGEFGPWITTEESTCISEGTQIHLCNSCGAKEEGVIRTTEHIYDNSCDTRCNFCGYIREIEHTYDNACDISCNICDYIRTVGPHTYSYVCDENCNVCGYIRVAEPHVYTDSCDTGCNVCYKYRPITHTYDNACDTSCNVCGSTRTITHAYNNTCDTSCNVCGNIRTITHTYDNACDTECNVCGNIRTISHNYSLKTITPPTCYENGYTTYKCSVCGYSYIDDYTDATGHRVQATEANATVLPVKMVNPTSYRFGFNNGIYNSTNKGKNSTSTFTITALKDCEIEIQYYTSTENNCDKLTITHNSTRRVTASGINTTWQKIDLSLAEGDTVYIKYSKDDSVSSGDDAIYFKLDISSDYIEPTCTDDVVCDECGEVLKLATGHNYSTNWTIDVAPTCTEEGSKSHHCIGCDDKKDITEIEATGHTEVTDVAVAPACTETGLTEGSHCSVCNAVIIAQNVVPATGHSYGAWVVNSAPTCTGTGSKSRSCSNCGNIETSRIEANGHSYSTEWTIDVAPTCTATGSKSHHCTVCDAKTDVTVIEATGHTEVIDGTVAATCTETGLTEGKHCSVCNAVIVAQNAIPATGHTEVIDGAVAATCTETGLTEGKHCSVCNTVIVAQNVVPATGHTEVVDVAVAATCTETGLTEGKHCSVCNAVTVAQNVVPATGHTEVVDAAVAATCTETGLTEGKHCSVCNVVTVAQNVVPATGHTEVVDAVVAATCTETGLTEGKHCSVCNTVIVAQNVIPATGHSYGDWIVDTEPTCTGTGSKSRSCSICGNIETSTISAKGHSYSNEWTIDVAPTCTATGSKSHHCTACDDKKDITIIEATGHTESDWIIDSQATCITPGSKHIECTNCSFIIEIVPILATGHSIVTDPAKEATCTETGITEGKHCSVCNVVIVAQNVVPAKGHTTTEWIVDADSTCTEKGTKHKECTVCNATVETVEIPVKGHTTVIDAAVAPSCTTTGKTEGSHCSVCNAIIVAQNTIPATDHNYSDWVIEEAEGCGSAGVRVKTCLTCGHKVYETISAAGHTEVKDAAIAPTCTTVGKTEGSHCSVCGAAIIPQITIPATGHTLVKDVAVEATCTTTGKTEGSHCSVCNAIIVAQNTIPATDHNYSDWVIEEAEGCGSAGVRVKTCLTCGHKVYETISAAGHTEVKDTAIDPTCTTVGKTEGSHCSVCGAAIIPQITIPATGHTVVKDVAVEATCTTTGKTEGSHCSVCGAAIIPQITIPATGHTEVVDAAVAATCTEKGLTEGSHCSVCNVVIVAQNVVPAKGHTSSDWIIDKEATCTEAGSKHRECTVCQANLETVEIIATGHTSVKDAAVAATCTETGLTEGSHCSVCNAVIKAQETVKAKGHKAGSWKTEKKATVNAAGKKVKKCTVCGETVETGKIAQLKCNKPSLKKIENTADGVKITWGKVSGADSYAVYRKTGSGAYKKIATVKGNSKVTYTDKKAKSGKKYYYQVKAVNEAGESSASGSKSIYYLADTTLSTPKSTKNGITLKWKKVTGADGYQVWRKTGSGSYKKIATVKGNSKVTYTDKKAQKGKTYTYKIKAYKGNTTSAYSNAKKIKDKY